MGSSCPRSVSSLSYCRRWCHVFRLGVRWCSFCGVTAVPLFVVVGSVVVVVLCHGVGVMVWWGSQYVVVMWSSCGDVVIVWSL